MNAEHACKLAEPLFRDSDSRQPPVAQVAGQPASFAAAIEMAARILQNADSPLIYGLSRSSTEGQRAAIALAEQIGATIDTTASLCHAPSIMAIQDVGEVTCTLGEVKNRADLVIFWGANPAESHPRHLERYALYPKGRFLPRGRADRFLVVVDVKPTETSKLADLYLPVAPGCDYEILTALRTLIRGQRLPENTELGMPIEALEQLAERMKSCRYGIVFFGLGLSMTGIGQHNVAALLQLVTDLNRYTRFSARRMRIPGDITGTDMVLTWQTGYPFSVNFARGYPRYNPGEFSAQQMLERAEVDACVFVGSEGAARFSTEALNCLAKIPTIVLDYPSVRSSPRPTIRFTTAVYGIHRPGTAYRMDGIPIPLKALLPSEYPSDHEVLKAIQNQITLNTR